MLAERKMLRHILERHTGRERERQREREIKDTKKRRCLMEQGLEELEKPGTHSRGR